MKHLEKGKQAIICTLLIAAILLSGLCRTEILGKGSKRDYGVFLSLDGSDIDRIAEYRTVVIDAQYFTKKEISYLKKHGCTVYSYLNIGSIENFREYYDTYSDLTLGAYENWNEEQWMDVSSKDWQKFLKALEKELLKKKIDGFFVDNCDVYYMYPTEEIFQGIASILEYLMGYDVPVVINGGDTFVMEYVERFGSPDRIMTGVNQESVWTEIDFDTGKLVAQSKNTRLYFQEYVETCSSYGLDVYLLEYTKKNTLKKKIKKYCTQKHFHYYISDSIELD